MCRHIPITEDHTNGMVIHLLKNRPEDLQPRMFADVVTSHDPMILNEC
jgi:hypothetical protein